MRTQRTKWLLYLPFSMPVLIVLYMAICGAVFSLLDFCDVKVLSVKPNGPYAFVLFTVDCGVTTSEAGLRGVLLYGDTKVSKEKLLSEDNQIFSYDSDHRPALTDKNGILRVDARWVEKDRFRVTIPRRSRVFLSKTNYKEIKIEYRYFGG